MPGRTHQSGSETKEKFTGKERDAETGLDYFGARYYSPALGRWLAVDPFTEKYAGWSPYTFTLDNPQILVDRDGRAPEDAKGAGYYTASVNLKTLAFLIRHPNAALEIGLPQRGRTNISTNAVRFSTRIGLPENMNKEGSHVNAYRHVLWQATITEKFGVSIAAQLGNAHEAFPFIMERTTFPSLKGADQQADLRNNIIGREIGVQNPSASMQQLAIKVLEYFKNNGLWVAIKQNDGTYRIQKVKLTDEQYKRALKILKTLNNEGYTEEEQKRKDEKD